MRAFPVEGVGMGVRVTVFACLAAALSVSAAAEEPEFDAPPEWLRKPSSQQLMSVWPAEALKNRVTGAATIRCKVNLRGVLYDCAVESEEPPDAGFGAAAMTLTPQFLMKLPTKNGVAVETGVRIPVRFSAPDLPWPMAWGGEETLKTMREVLSHPAWLDAPTLADVAAAYPEKARTARVGGQVTLACVIADKGGLDPCSVILESPNGLGFGKAAKRLVPRFKPPETGPDGAPLKDAAVNIVFSFTPDMLDGKYPPSRQYWVEKPSPADLAARLPEAARKAGPKEAQAEMICRVAPQGRLSDCAASGETPTGMGLGEAALALAPKYRVSPWSSDGVPIVGVKVRVPVAFVSKPAAPGS
jgi:TonB family protein